MAIKTEIDWEHCQRRLITASAELPDNIRAIRVPTLDAQALHTAFSLLGGKVTSVQIETEDVPAVLIGFPHDYIMKNGRFNIEIQPVEFKGEFVRTTDQDIVNLLNTEFSRRSSEIGDEAIRSRMQVWHDCVLRMPLAAAELFPNAYKGLWIRGDGRFDQREHPGFHRHGGFYNVMGDMREIPGYFLNFTPSHDGTVFPDEQGNLWYARGGAYSLFTSDGHLHVDGCDHEVPDRFMSPIENERRATAVLQVFPVPEP